MPNAYFRLMRLHQPTGIWLLLWPCWWSAMLANHGLVPFRLLALFALGASVMRSAGCVLNDIVDRTFDAQVERTRTRPLASGEVSIREAVALLAVLLAIALCIALMMKPIVLVLSAASLFLVASYPFMKRITWWPQAFLGLTFNWGALLGWAAVTGSLAYTALLLYAGGIGWTLGYDTIYAHQDKEDDRKIGVKSTALLFGNNSKLWIAGFYGIAILFWNAAGLLEGRGWPYFAGLGFVALHFIWQVYNVRLNDTASCLKIFRSNTIVGWLFFAGLCGEGIRIFGFA